MTGLARLADRGQRILDAAPPAGLLAVMAFAGMAACLITLPGPLGATGLLPGAFGCWVLIRSGGAR